MNELGRAFVFLFLTLSLFSNVLSQADAVQSGNTYGKSVSILNKTGVQISEYVNGKTTSRIFRFDEIIDKAGLGDINNDGTDELILFSHKKESETNYTDMPNGYIFNLNVYKIGDDKADLLWSDNGTLQYGNPDVTPPDDMGSVGDIDNSGQNILIIRHARSDMSPAVFDFLQWENNALSIQQTISFEADKVDVGIFDYLKKYARLKNEEAMPFLSGIGFDSRQKGNKIHAGLITISDEGRIASYAVGGIITNNKFVVKEVLERIF
jgi:hypothetical protein